MKYNRLLIFKEDFPSLVLFLILPIIYLSAALFSTDNILGSQITDLRNLSIYSKEFAFDALSNLSIPLWNPYIFGGMPFIATLHTAVFYPFNLISGLFPLTHAVNWNIALHLFLSEIFTYCLLKHYGAGIVGATVAGIVYTFSAPQIMHIYAGHIPITTSMVWTPLMFLFLDRIINRYGYKYGVLLSITIALQLLAGFPQDLFYSMIALSLYSLFFLFRIYRDEIVLVKIWQIVPVLIFFVVLGLALSAIQIFPTAEMTKYSTRENLGYNWVSVFSFPPENLITFLIPDFFGDMLKVPHWGKNYLWEMTVYAGIMPLLLALIAIFFVRGAVVWFFTGLALLSIVLAFGKYTPLLKLLFSYVPGFNLFRGNSKFIFLNALSLSVLSGFGASALSRGVHDLKKYRIEIYLIASISIFVTSALLLIYFIFDGVWFREAVARAVYSGDFYYNPEGFLRQGFETAAMECFRSSTLRSIIFLISGMALFSVYLSEKINERAVILSVLLFIVLDLFSFGMRYMVTFNRNDIDWEKEVVEFLKRDKEPFRVIAPYMGPNSGMSSEVEVLGGYDTILVKRYSEFINLSQGLPLDNAALSLNITSVNRLTDLLNTRYLVLPSGLKGNNPSFILLVDNGRYQIYQNLNAFPRAFVVHATKLIQGRESIFKELMSPEFNPSSYAIIEEEMQNLSNVAAKSPIPRIIKYSPNQITLEANLIKPGLLVLGDVYYPGWKAFVNGKETEIYKANYVMRGVLLSEGVHIVEFRYEPLSFKIGAFISLATLVFIAGFFLWERRRYEDTEASS